MVERERLFPTHDPAQLPNFEPLVVQAKLGNQQAFFALDEYLRPRFHRYFSRRLREEADDLTQETMIRITTRLDTFKLKDGGEWTYSQRFIWWCLRIAKNRLNTEFRRQAEQKGLIHMPAHHAFDEFAGKTVFHSGENGSQTELDMQKDNNVLMVRLKKSIDEILSPAQREIVKQTLEGKSIQEIASQRECQERSIIGTLSLARIKIENSLLTPAGYIHAARFGQAIKTAVSRGHVPSAVRFLRMWYVTQESVYQYKQTKQGVDQELIDQGYVVLSQNASRAEVAAIKRDDHNQKVLVLQRGKFYVKPESLDAFRRRKKKGASTINPPEGYHALTAFAQTQTGAKKLQAAASKGTLKAIKQGLYWFTTQESVNEFQRRDQRTLPRKGVIFPVK